MVSGSQREDNVNQVQEAQQDFLEEEPLELAVKNKWGFTRYLDWRSTL